MPIDTGPETEHLNIPVHHMDARGVEVMPTDLPTNFDTPEPLETGPNFGPENPAAFGVFERSAQDWNPNYVLLQVGTQTVLLSGRTKGRKAITISVPSSFIDPNDPTFTPFTPSGIVLGSNRGSVDVFQGVQLNAGDSTTISTEAPVYVGLLPGASTKAVAQYIEEVNALGGNLGAF